MTVRILFVILYIQILTYIYNYIQVYTVQDRNIIVRIDEKTKKEFEYLCQKSGRKMGTLIKSWIKEFNEKERKPVIKD